MTSLFRPPVTGPASSSRHFKKQTTLNFFPAAVPDVPYSGAAACTTQGFRPRALQAPSPSPGPGHHHAVLFAAPHSVTTAPVQTPDSDPWATGRTVTVPTAFEPGTRACRRPAEKRSVAGRRRDRARVGEDDRRGAEGVIGPGRRPARRPESTWLPVEM